MLLSALLHKKRLENVATAIPAISATQPPKEAATVARIATVAIANPSSEKLEKNTQAITRKTSSLVATAIPAISATAIQRVMCCDCSHFAKDKIGSGLGVGDCLVGQAEHQPTPLWARSERRCSEWASSDLTGSYQA